MNARYAYSVEGSVRGKISVHRTLTGAIRSLRRDRAGCASLGGAYSDVTIRAHTDVARAELERWEEDQ